MLSKLWESIGAVPHSTSNNIRVSINQINQVEQLMIP